MLFSIALMLLFGMAAGGICKKLHLPALLGMLLTGMVLGPYAGNLLDASILTISPSIRRIALIIILLRAGLSLDIGDLKKVGRPAVLMCFVPACFEMVGMVLLAPRILGVSVIDAAIIGAVVAAVSPAVIVPKMLKLMEEGYGTKEGIPQLILAGASVDDVFVIVMFTAFTGLAQGEDIELIRFAEIPGAIILGIVAGIAIGWLLGIFFEKVHLRDTVKVMLLLCAAFLLVTLEDAIGSTVPFSGLIAVMCLGIALQKKREQVAERLSVKFSKLWVGAEVLLFVLVGATVDLKYVGKVGILAVLLIFGVLIFRGIGVYCCLIATKLTRRERIFCMLAYTPKATVQAAIGGVPLSMGLACGNIVLAVAVLAILITAPLGAFLIEVTYSKLLKRELS